MYPFKLFWCCCKVKIMYSYSVLVGFAVCFAVVYILLNDTICVQQELQDRNDELSSELEVLKNQGSGRKTRQSRDRFSAPTWSSCKPLTANSDSGKDIQKVLLTTVNSRHWDMVQLKTWLSITLLDDPESKRGSSPKIKKCTKKNGKLLGK